MADHYDFILKLRAIRDYQPDAISDDDLAKILEAARWTGSSKNRQNWSFVVVADPDRLQALAGYGSFTKPIRESAATIVLVEESGGNAFDIGRAAQNIMLAAKAVGVATCPITLHDSEGAREFLGAPAKATTKYAVAMGYPTETAEPRRYGGRKDPRKIIKLDRY